MSLPIPPAHAACTWQTKYHPVVPQVLDFAHEETLFSSNNCFSGKDWPLSHKALRAIISFRSGLHFTEIAFIIFLCSPRYKKKILMCPCIENTGQRSARPRGGAAWGACDGLPPTRTAQRSVLRPGAKSQAEHSPGERVLE